MKKGGLYLSMGDSTTWTGYGAVNVNSGAYLYSHLLWNYINNNYSDIQFINKGIGGTDSNKMVENLFWLIRNIVPDLVTIGVGMNDCANNNIPTATYQANLALIVSAIKQKNPNCVIVFCTPSRCWEATRVNNVAAYRTAMIAEAATLGISSCDFGTAWTQSPSDMATCLSDPSGIHPNYLGHQQMYNVLLPVVLSAASSWLGGLG